MSFGSRRGRGTFQSSYSSRNIRNSYSGPNYSFDEVNGFNLEKTSSGAAHDPVFKQPPKPLQSLNQRGSLRPNIRNSYSGPNYSFDEVNGFNLEKTRSGATRDPAFKQPPKPLQSLNQKGSLRPNPQCSNQRESSNPSTFNKRAHELKADFLDPEHKGTLYRFAKNWHDKHKLAYFQSRCMALEYENKMLFDQVTQLIEENSISAMGRGEVPKMQLPHIPALHEQQSNIPRPKKGAPSNNTQHPQKKQGKNKQQFEEATDDSATQDKRLVFEVSEDMMNFLEQSMLHKLSLYKERKAEEDKEREEKEKLRKMGPVQPLGLVAKEELNQLYGSKAATIQELETSVRLKFNRYFDLHKTQIWPNIPMNSHN